jgi:hypothetical protein
MLTSRTVIDEERRKKQSRALRPLERATLKLMRRQLRASQVYINEHIHSNQRKKNGWARDFRKNLARALRRSRSS